MLCIALRHATSQIASAVEQKSDEAFGFVAFHITVYDGLARKRVKAVSNVFAYCRTLDRPSAMLATAESAISPELRARFGATFEVTQRYVSGFDRAADASAQRKAALNDRYFGAHLRFEFSWSRHDHCEPTPRRGSGAGPQRRTP
jgi:hypothetical protein